MVSKGWPTGDIVNICPYYSLRNTWEVASKGETTMAFNRDQDIVRVGCRSSQPKED